ncbi:hypothetical protein PG985_006566 [Apiospora marii]|uniref:uncharacterized protein n=1 Tax=Apiospora marii TaxID=335849 RepID=UPI0031310A53
MVVPKPLRAVAVAAATLTLLSLTNAAAVVPQQAQGPQVLHEEPYSDNTTIVCPGPGRRACSGLFGYLSDKGSTAPPRDSVAVCWVDHDDPAGNNQCCTAWRQWNSGIVMGYLLGAATKTWNQCKTGGGLVGGVTNEVNLNGICQSQCLGNTRECF